MTVHHEIDASTGRIDVHLAGAVTAAEVLEVLAAIGADPALRPNLGLLADCREVTATPSFLELGMIANAKPHAPPGEWPTRAAAVVSSRWLFGIVRQFAALAEPNGMDVSPFYDENEAKQWLVATADPQPVGVVDR